MFKRIIKISLLTILLSLILFFNFGYKSKAYYTWETSYINVYIDGDFVFKTLVSELPTDSYPEEWLFNEYTRNKNGSYRVLDAVSYDTSGTDVCSNYGEFYDQIMTAFSYSGVTGNYESNIYLWFVVASSNYADVTFIMTDGQDVYDEIVTRWNCSFPMQYDDFPISFWNVTDACECPVMGGTWMNCNIYPIKSIYDDYYTNLLGGQSYKFEYYVTDPDYYSDIYKQLHSFYVPEIFSCTEDTILLPRYINGYPVQYYYEPSSGFENYLKFGTASNSSVPLVRLQDLKNNSVLIKFGAVVLDEDCDEPFEYHREFEILLEPKGMYLEAPELTYDVNVNGVTYLKWNSVEKADYYELWALDYDGDLDYVFDEVSSFYNSYKMPGAFYDRGVYTIAVKACSNLKEYYNDSLYSNSIVYYNLDESTDRLQTPELVLDDHILKWDYNSSASFYNLYLNDELIKAFPATQTQFDVHFLDLLPGTHYFRLISVAKPDEDTLDSQYSSKITYVEPEKELVLNYNFESFKTIPKVTTKDALLAELPEQLSLSTGVAFVQKYYLDKDMTQEISKDSIFAYWSNNNYRHLDLYLLVVQPLVYEGPTLIYKNPDSMLSTKKITSIVDSYCKTGTKDSYTLKLVDDGYTGNGDKAGNYTMKYECIVGTYTTNINITIKVTSSVKAAYIYNKKWFSDEVISVENVISTAKAVGLLPDTTLNGFNVVSLHNDYKNDYYADKAAFGSYMFIIDFACASGEEGVVQFEVNYLEPDDWSGQEVEPEFPIGTVVTVVILIAVSIGAIVFVKNFKKTNKYKSKKKF